MKKTFVILITICILCTSILPVMAEDSNTNILIKEPTMEEVLSDCITIDEDNFTPSKLPRYTDEINLFSVRSTSYTDEQKAAKLRDFLVERLSNIETYQDELTLGEYRFSGESVKSDVLYFDLSGLYDFELYYDAANQSSTKEILRNATNDIRDKYPRIFWCKNQYTWSWNGEGKLTQIGFRLDCDIDFDVKDGLQPVIDEVTALTAEFDGYVQSIVDLIPDDYSDYEKILFVNDYLCTNYKYDIRYYTNNAAKLHISNAYDFFKEGKGVCQAYTLAFMAIMDELCIRCDSVLSEEMNHLWNLVELNGKWYHIDVTWNDPAAEMYDADTLGKAMHKYFLLSSECMQDSSHDHTGFDVESYGYEIGTEFDEVEVNLNQSLKSSFIKLNGTWYNTGYNENTRTCGLYAFESSDISLISNSDFETPLCNIGKWGYKGCYSYLSKYKNNILFNTPTSICMFDGNQVTELYAPEKADNEKIYGFTLKDDTIYMQLATNPNSSGMQNATIETVNLADLIGPTIKDYDETAEQATIYTSNAINGIIIFASYDTNDKLIDCAFINCAGDTKITAGINKYDAPDDFNTTGAQKVKVMLWENSTALKPLCAPLEK